MTRFRISAAKGQLVASCDTRPVPTWRRALVPARHAGALVVAFGICTTVPVGAQTASSAAGASSRAPATSRAEEGPTWSSLKPAQRDALKPLEREWSGIDPLRKQKWLEIADRFPSMTAQDKSRLHERMAEWTKLSPMERGQVRMNYLEARQAPPQNRQASWEAYQALSDEQRRELAERAPQARQAASGVARGAMAGPSVSAPRGVKPARDGPQPKSNTVPEPVPTALSKPVAPTVVQAQPGATTRLITKPTAPPAHQPSGMPKIAATPEYVDKKTLLPQTGAQSSNGSRPPAASPAAASAPRP